MVNVNNDNGNGRESRAGLGLALVLMDIGGSGSWWTMVEGAGGGGFAGGIADYAAENTGRRGRSQYPRVISHTFPQFRETPLRAAHPRRAGGIGTAAASRGRFNSSVRKTCAIIRSASCVFSQNHARWNRLYGLCAPAWKTPPAALRSAAPSGRGPASPGRGGGMRRAPARRSRAGALAEGPEGLPATRRRGRRRPSR